MLNSVRIVKEFLCKTERKSELLRVDNYEKLYILISCCGFASP